MNMFNTLVDPDATVLTSLSFLAKNFISVFVMVDPFAAIPLYLILTERLTPPDVLKTAKKCVFVASGILLSFAITGMSLLSFFGISIAALRIAGGILLLKFALEQMGGAPQKIKKDEKDESLHRDNIAIVPLALPLLAGPGSISTIVVQSTNNSSFLKLILLCAAISLVMWSSYLVLRSSQYLFRFMGKTGISLLERLMGIIVAAIAIQFILTGLGDSFPTLVAVATSTLK